MIGRTLDRKYSLILSCLALTLIAFAYQCLSWQRRSVNPKDTTMPGLVEILTDGTYKIITPDSFGNIWIFQDVVATGKRLAFGLTSGVLIAFLIGVSMGTSSIVEAFLKWPVTFFGQIPPTAMLAVYLVVANLSGIPLVPMMVCFGIMPALAFTIYNSVKVDIHDELIYKAYTLGASNMEVVCNVVIQQIFPRVIDAVRICIGPALVYLIAAEWANEHVGFGYRLKIQGRQTHMAVVYNYLGILALFGFFFDWSLMKLRKFLFPWFDIRK